MGIFGKGFISVIGGTSAPTSFFSKFGTPFLAYSLRDLSLAGNNVIQVRRSSDNALQDFTAAEILNGTMAAFVGAGNDGFVRIWYNQADETNSTNAIQTTTSAQPQIVSGGSTLVDDEGNPKIEYKTTPKALITPVLSMGNQSLTLFSYRKSDVATIQIVFELSSTWISNNNSFVSTSNEAGEETGGSRGSQAVSTSQVATITSPPITDRILTSEFHDLPNSISQIRVNKTLGTEGLGAKGSGNFNNYPLYIGARNGNSTPVQGFISELIIYKSDARGVQLLIENDIHEYYKMP